MFQTRSTRWQSSVKTCSQNSKYRGDPPITNLSRRSHRSDWCETLPAIIGRTNYHRRRKFRTSDSYLHIRLYACPFLAKTHRYRSRRYIAAVFSRIQNSFSRWDSACVCSTDTTRVSAYICVKIRCIERSPSCLQNISLLPSAVLPLLADPLFHPFPLPRAFSLVLARNLSTYVRILLTGIVYIAGQHRTRKSSNPSAFVHIRG